jgi:hypothetical protein
MGGPKTDIFRPFFLDDNYSGCLAAPAGRLAAACGSSFILVVADFSAYGRKISNNQNSCEPPQAMRSQKE